jgi:hypothetical protein
MANNTLAVTNLDYAGLQTSLIDFMRANPQFKDYDFEGSNLRTLIDVMAYNTYINSFYTNMAINEMFIDTAVLRDSVVSHAKDLNYVPRSARSAQALIDIQVTPTGNPAYIAIPTGQRFQGSDGNAVFTFVTTSNTIITPTSNAYVKTQIPIYEGVVLTEKFIVDTSIQDQRFIISNPYVDTTTLTVTVTNSLGNAEKWTYYADLFNVKTTTKAYFLQATADKFEIVFGHGVTGAAPPNGATITATYVACNQDKPNGCTRFKSMGSIGGYTNFVVTPSKYSNGQTVSAAGGMAPETTKSIRFNAPRAYQTLQRAITAEDYRNILFLEYPDIRDIYVYGGDQVDPPQYGRVYIAVDLVNATGLSSLEKTKIQSFISTRAPITITPVVIEADYTMIGVTCNIKYDLNTSSLAASDVQSKILAAMQTYNTSNLEKFNARFRYSQLLAAIDGADPSIVDNETTTTLIKEFIPTLNENYSGALKFQNPINAGSIYTTGFTYNGLECSIVDDSAGNLKIISTVNGVQTPLIIIGSVDYTTGIVNILNLNVSNFVGNYIAVYATPTNHDFNSSQNTIMQIEFGNVSVNVEGIRV